MGDRLGIHGAVDILPHVGQSYFGSNPPESNAELPIDMSNGISKLGLVAVLERTAQKEIIIISRVPPRHGYL